MNRVTKILGIKYPIVQAPLSWITSAELVAAVSNVGGLGTLGPNAGQTTVSDTPSETAERLKSEIIKTRQLTDKPFGVNYLITHDDKTDAFSEAILKVLIEENVKIIVAVGDANAKKIRELKNLGFTVIFRELTPSVAGAKAAEEGGADILGATGFDAGGFTPQKAIGTMTIVPLLADNVKIPVLAAGGIVDKRTVNASFALGAEGVYVGTRFIASLESPASDIAKMRILKYNTDDMILYPTTYSYNRATPGKLALELKDMDNAGATGEDIDKIMYANGGIKTGMLEGDTDLGIDSYSNGIGLIRDIKSCKEIIEDLIQDYIPVA